MWPFWRFSMELVTTAFAVRAASSGVAPWASSAVTAAARVQPAPLTRSWPILGLRS